MEAGLTIINEGSSVQIDSTYRNMLLVASGQFTINKANQGADLWYNQLISVWSRATSAVMLAVRAPGPWGLALNIGSTRDGKNVCNFNYKRNTSVTFQYYIYDLVEPTVSATFGLEVYNQDKKLVYSTADYPMQIVQPVKWRGSGTYVGANADLAYACTGGGYQVSIDSTDTEEDITYSYWDGNTLIRRTDHVVDEYFGSAVEGNWGNWNQDGLVVNTKDVPKNYMRN